jgi:2-oxoglutarate dehydrogenase E2 component (dihydrolipoamide succinyltransferase)
VTIEIKAPTFPESISDGTIATWHKQPGEAVRRDDVLVEVETDKVVLEVVAPADGTLKEVLKGEGSTVVSEEVLAIFVEGAATDRSTTETAPAAAPAPQTQAPSTSVSPAARKLADENRVDLARINGTGRSGRITKEDVAKVIASPPAAEAPTRAAASGSTGAVPTPPRPAVARPQPSTDETRVERRVPMTRLRSSIARRLVEAQHNAAMLTTFNEVNMAAITELRARYREQFERRHNGTRLGFMSFFVRATVEALKRFPAVNASIDGTDIVYHGYYDIGVAVSTERGLVVPVIRDADALGLAQIEDLIREYGAKARDGKLAIEDMAGGTFTISNGGVFGSLLSTPILNPPQTGILGMHKIEDRPIVENGQIVIRPMMYLALSYDHRLIDGQEAVRFLVTIKDLLEEPARIWLDL